ESGQGHYPIMVLLHSGFLVAMLVEAWVRRPDVPETLAWTMLALVVASQALRWWCIATLGRRWNTRVIIVPGLPPVTSGPYRFLSHPNYVAVGAEGIALPMVHGAWVTALVFTVANAALLAVRIRVENAALRPLPGRFADAGPARPGRGAGPPGHRGVRRPGRPRRRRRRAPRRRDRQGVRRGADAGRGG